MIAGMMHFEHRAVRQLTFIDGTTKSKVRKTLNTASIRFDESYCRLVGVGVASFRASCGTRSVKQEPVPMVLSIRK